MNKQSDARFQQNVFHFKHWQTVDKACTWHTWLPQAWYANKLLRLNFEKRNRMIKVNYKGKDSLFVQQLLVTVIHEDSAKTNKPRISNQHKSAKQSQNGQESVVRIVSLSQTHRKTYQFLLRTYTRERKPGSLATVDCLLGRFSALVDKPAGYWETRLGIIEHSESIAGTKYTSKQTERVAHVLTVALQLPAAVCMHVPLHKTESLLMHKQTSARILQSCSYQIRKIYVEEVQNYTKYCIKKIEPIDWEWSWIIFSCFKVFEVGAVSTMRIRIQNCTMSNCRLKVWNGSAWLNYIWSMSHGCQSMPITMSPVDYPFKYKSSRIFVWVLSYIHAAIIVLIHKNYYHGRYNIL